MISTQHSLVLRLQRGACDFDLDRFYALYEKPILAFAAARSLDEAECCDILQETMVKMLRGGFARFDPAKGRFTTFLFNVAKGCVIDALRRGARRESRLVPIDAPVPDGSAPLSERLPDLSDTPADAAERQGQLALIFIALDFLIGQKCFQAKTVELSHLRGRRGLRVERWKLDVERRRHRRCARLNSQLSKTAAAD